MRIVHVSMKKINIHVVIVLFTDILLKQYPLAIYMHLSCTFVMKRTFIMRMVVQLLGIIFPGQSVQQHVEIVVLLLVSVLHLNIFVLETWTSKRNSQPGLLVRHPQNPVLSG